MSELSNVLREAAGDQQGKGNTRNADVFRGAADEIDRLTARNKLLEAVAEMVGHYTHFCGGRDCTGFVTPDSPSLWQCDKCRVMAEKLAALKGEQDLPADEGRDYKAMYHELVGQLATADDKQSCGFNVSGGSERGVYCANPADFEIKPVGIDEWEPLCAHHLNLCIEMDSVSEQRKIPTDPAQEND